MASTILTSAGIRAGCQTNAWPIDPGKPATLFSALQAIEELGFAGFETGFRNVLRLMDEERRVLREKSGLAAFGVHIFLHEYDAETRVAPQELVLEVAAVAAAIGAERLILSGGPAPVEGGAAKAKADALNAIAVRIRPFGLQLAYHNHGPEFAGAEPEIESLLSNTNPELVSFLLDAGHVFRAGMDVPAFLTRHSNRLTGVHLRDFQDGRQAPLGQGAFPLQQVARTLESLGWCGWVLAEEEREDGSKPGLSAAGPARDAIRQAFRV